MAGSNRRTWALPRKVLFSFRWKHEPDNKLFHFTLKTLTESGGESGVGIREDSDSVSEAGLRQIQNVFEVTDLRGVCSHSEELNCQKDLGGGEYSACFSELRSCVLGPHFAQHVQLLQFVLRS